MEKKSFSSSVSCFLGIALNNKKQNKTKQNRKKKWMTRTY